MKLTEGIGGATFCLVILTTLNLLNFIDRYIPSAIKDDFKEELHLTDVETSLPQAAFVVMLMFLSPIFGMLADRGYSRKLLLSFGVFLWSLATAAGYFAIDFWTLLLSRTFVGIGEAAYGAITPTLLSDYYPPDKRNRVLTIYYLSIPVGAAMGFILGGIVGTQLGWRAAFLISGAPGMLFAGLILLIRDPGRGVFDKDDSSTRVPWKQAIKMLATNKVYVTLVVGYIFVVFASGGMADWMPTYLKRYFNLDYQESGLIVGSATIVAGILGMALGGFLGDLFKDKTRQSYFAVSAVPMYPATVLSLLTIFTPNIYAVSVFIFLTQVAMWFYNGPINAMIANSVPVSIRNRAFGVSILLCHLLGDAISPSIIGQISTWSSLKAAAILMPLMLLLSGVTWTIGWRCTEPQYHLLEEDYHLENSDQDEHDALRP